MTRAFTTREKVLLVILAVMIIGVCYFKFILEPIDDQIAELQMQTQSEQSELDANMVLLLQMQQMQQELDAIHASGDEQPIPSYDNAGALMIELNTILAQSSDYSLSFGNLETLEGGYIVRRPISLSFSTNTYDQARTIIDDLHESQNINQISDVTIQNQTASGRSAVAVALTITYFELAE